MRASLKAAILFALAAAGQVALGPAASAKQSANVLFKNTAPAGLAARLAAECTRRLMPVTRNTPEMVVCKHRERFTSEAPVMKAAELWTFELAPSGSKHTRALGSIAVEGATSGGYASVSFQKPTDEEKRAIADFLKDVRDLDGMRGLFLPRPEALED